MTSSVPTNSVLILITGSRGAGKTSLCQSLIKEARDAGWTVKGLLSVPVFDGETRAAIDAIDLQSGEQRRLADRIVPGTGEQAKGPATVNWQFHADTLAWGNQVLNKVSPAILWSSTNWDRSNSNAVRAGQPG